MILVFITLFINFVYTVRAAQQNLPIVLSGIAEGWRDPNQARNLWMFVVVLFWVGILALAKRWSRGNPSVHVTSLVLGSAGYGFLLVFLADGVGITVNPVLTTALLLLPLVGSLFVLRWKPPAAAPNVPLDLPLPSWAAPLRRHPSYWRGAVWLVAAVVVFTVAAMVIEAWVNLAWQRGPARGDEAYYWLSSTTRTLLHGFSGYKQMDANSNYDPGYPMLGSFFLGLFPRAHMDAQVHALPMIYGLLLLFAWFDLLPRWALKIRLALGVMAAGQLVGHAWAYSMFFKLWYGEALPILALVGIFHLKNLEGPPDYWRLFQLFGLGAMGALSKPPLAYLLVGAIIPTFFLMDYFLRKDFSWKREGLPMAACFLGAVVATLLWKWNLRVHNQPSFYVFKFSTLLNPQWSTGGFPTLIQYFFPNYKLFWVSFVLTAAAALWLDFRRMFSHICVVLGMSLSIFILFATFWSVVDSESGGRYLLHGLISWNLFSVPYLLHRMRA